MTNYAIGLDLGGNSAKIGLISENAQVIAEASVPIVPGADAQSLLHAIAQRIYELQHAAADQSLPIVAIGCGVPGYLDSTCTSIVENNIHALDGFPLGKWLSEQFQLPTFLDNDSCMAAIAEAAIGIPRQLQRVLLVTVGSGLGVVLMVGGEIARVTKGVTGDAGHLIVNPNSDQRCPFGCRGCLETVATGSAIAWQGRRAGINRQSRMLQEMLLEKGDITGAHVTAAAANGDPVARSIIYEAGRWLGIGLASWAAIYQPDLVLLGGGVSEAGDLWMDSAVTSMRAVGSPFWVQRIQVRQATLGRKAGMIGAALSAQRKRKIT